MWEYQLIERTRLANPRHLVWQLDPSTKHLGMLASMVSGCMEKTHQAHKSMQAQSPAAAAKDVLRWKILGKSHL